MLRVGESAMCRLARLNAGQHNEIFYKNVRWNSFWMPFFPYAYKINIASYVLGAIAKKTFLGGVPEGIRLGNGIGAIAR